MRALPLAWSVLSLVLGSAGCAKNQASPQAATSTQGALLPSCGDPEPPHFPAESAGAEFRAIVLVTVSKGGGGEDLCYLRYESRGDFEQTALADRADWRFDPAHAGQKRERLVVYRLSKAVNN